MKQPRFPGAEKFKFASSEKPLATPHGALTGVKHHDLVASSSVDGASPSKYAFHSRNSSVSILSKPLMPTTSVPLLNRNDIKRRAILPISSKKTCRMLTNTDVELNVDHVDVAPEETSKAPRHLGLETPKVPSCPNLEASSRSLHASKTSLDTYFRKMSLRNSAIKELPPDFDWKNIRASPSRLSASCSTSSFSSEENVWVPREDSGR